MVNTVVIVASAFMFSLVGLGVSYVAAAHYDPPNENTVLVFTLFPPIAGGLFGLIVGVIAAVVGHWTTRTPASTGKGSP